MKHRIALRHLVACDRQELGVNYSTALSLGLKTELAREAFPVSQ